MTMLACSTYFARKAAGASRARYSPRPLFRGSRTKIQNSRENTRRDRGPVPQRHCEEHLRRSNPAFFLAAQSWIASRSLSSGARSRDPLARNDGVKRDRKVTHTRLPSLHAPLRVAGREPAPDLIRGRGWEVHQLAPLAASLLGSTGMIVWRHPPPPTPPRHAQGRVEGGEITAHNFAISPRVSREFCQVRSALLIRGRRECRAPDAPDSRVCNG